MKYIKESGIIDLALVQEQYEMKKREEILEKHPYKIWKGKNGKWYTYILNQEGKRVLKKRTNKKDIEDIIIACIKEQETNPTIEEIFYEWNDRRLELNKISSATYLRNKQLYHRYYDTFGKQKIKVLDEKSLNDFLEEQIYKFNLSAKGFSNLKTVTRGFLKRAKRLGYIDFKVEETLKELDYSEIEFNKKRKPESLQVFTDAETDKVLTYLKDNTDIINLGLILMFVTGMRVGELVTLKWEDVGKSDTGLYVSIKRTETRYKDDNNKFVYSVKESPKTEAGKRDVIIPRDYMWIMKKLRNFNPFTEYIFFKDNKRMNTEMLRRRLYRVCKNLDMPMRGTHAIRKTYGSILLDNNVDAKLIEGQMGHTNIMTTEQFYHKNRRTCEEKFHILSNVPQLRISQ